MSDDPENFGQESGGRCVGEHRYLQESFKGPMGPSCCLDVGQDVKT
jgi:hypothetical protein